MTHLYETFYALGFSDLQMQDFLTVLSIAEQEKDGKEIEIITTESKMQKLALIEEAARHIELEKELSELQKKGINIDADLKQQLIEQNDLRVKDLLTINALCQKVMLRAAGTERQQLVDNDKLEEHRDLITAALDRLGFISEIKPQNKKPDVLLVLGASQSSFTKRILTTVQYLEEEHVKPSALYLLGGQRPLWAVHEPVTAELVAERIFEEYPSEPYEEVLAKVREDFNERAKAVTDRSDSKQINTFRAAVITYYQNNYNIKWPTELDMMVRISEHQGLKAKGLKVIPVDTPMQADEFGKLTKRPNTKDTIISFKTNYANKIVHQDGAKVSVMATSSQPNIVYQAKPIEEVLGLGGFDIEVVGKGVDPKTYKIREAFDGLARSIFAGLGITLNKLVALDEKKEVELRVDGAWQRRVDSGNKGQAFEK